MTDAPNLAFAGVTALSRRLRAGDISPADLVESCLARIEALNHRLGCFDAVAAERARGAARGAASEVASGPWRGALHGIPFGLADGIDARGLGVAVPGGGSPERDATIAARLHEQGAILVGKLRVLPPAALPGRAGAPAAACRSPWDPARTAGGPSPGPAAAVAAGLVPFAITAAGAEPDTAAGECGVTSLRPTYGVLSRRGAVLGSFTLATLGIVARSAVDCALVLDTIAGADPRDASSIGPPPGITHLRPGLPKGLRVGIIEVPPAAGDDRDAWKGAQEALRATGALVAPAALPDLPWVPLAELLEDAEGTVVREDILGRKDSVAGPAAGASAADYVRGARLRGEAQRALAKLLERHDLLLAPAPRAAGGSAASDPLAAALAVAGLPALTLPIGVTGGRPIAARLVAPPLEEARLLSAAALFQTRSTHHLERPPIGSGTEPMASVTVR